MGSTVEFRSNGGSAQGWLAVPESGQGPGVIVIQEWWGIVAHIKEVCQRFAEAGFTALAPDLYHGKATSEPDEAAKHMMALNMEQAAKDLSGAVDFLRAHDAVTGDSLGVVGFCMGGSLTLLLAQQRPDAIGAAVPFYGVGPALAEANDWTAPSAAFQGHYAEHDDSAGPAAVRQLEAVLRQAGKEAQFFIYPGTQHAFFNDSRPAVYNAEASQLAWERTLRFLHEKLG
ncbi:MAG TPA: dienelactone hydrolase family protein [Chloroflexota bacterium]|jgi:carboxymethylenebutenolidase